MAVLVLLCPSVIWVIEKLFETTAAALHLWGLRKEGDGKRIGQRKKKARPRR